MLADHCSIPASCKQMIRDQYSSLNKVFESFSVGNQLTYFREKGMVLLP